VADEKDSSLFPLARHISLNMCFACIPRIQWFLVKDRILSVKGDLFPTILALVDNVNRAIVKA
jgi:hypothetical protein